jgi:carbamoyl-phosphate synthase large subunit
VKIITKKLSEGHPNVIDVIRDGTVDGVVNTVTGGRVPLRDGFEIRRAAAEKRIPCFTSLDTAGALSDVVNDGSSTFNVKPLSEYRNAAKAAG